MVSISPLSRLALIFSFVANFIISPLARIPIYAPSEDRLRHGGAVLPVGFALSRPMNSISPTSIPGNGKGHLLRDVLDSIERNDGKSLSKRQNESAAVITPRRLVDVGLDPTSSMKICGMVGVQAAVVDNRLYFAGGGIWFRDPMDRLEPTQVTINRRAVSFDLSKPFKLSAAGLNDRIISRPLPRGEEDGIRSLTGAAFFPGTGKIYSYHGAIPPRNFSDELFVENYRLKRTSHVNILDTTTMSWKKAPLVKEINAQLKHLELGSTVTVPQHGLGFWLSGIHFPIETQSNFEPVPELHRFDIATQEWEIERTPFDARIRGNLVFIDGVGKKGVLVSYAGQEFPGNKAGDSKTMSLEEVSVYDIDSRKWHTQKTTPDPRAKATGATGVTQRGWPQGREFPCSVVARAKDGSSHNIYMFGGLATPTSDERIGFKEVWVLSLPAFRWILVANGDDASDLWESNCQIVGKSQVLLIGGDLSYPDVKVPKPCQDNPLRAFDLNTLTWGEDIDINNAEFQVPRAVSAIIGGDGNGGATSKEPIDGFDSEEISNLFLGGSGSGPTPTGNKPGPSPPSEEAGRISSTPPPPRITTIPIFANVTSTFVSKTVRVITTIATDGGRKEIPVTDAITIVSTSSTARSTLTAVETTVGGSITVVAVPVPLPTEYPNEPDSVDPTETGATRPTPTPTTEADVAGSSGARAEAEKEEAAAAKRTTGIVAGSVLGAIAALSLVTVIVLFLRRRSSRHGGPGHHNRGSISRGLLGAVHLPAGTEWAGNGPPFQAHVTRDMSDIGRHAIHCPPPVPMTRGGPLTFGVGHGVLPKTPGGYEEVVRRERPVPPLPNNAAETVSHRSPGRSVPNLLMLPSRRARLQEGWGITNQQARAYVQRFSKGRGVYPVYELE